MEEQERRTADGNEEDATAVMGFGVVDGAYIEGGGEGCMCRQDQREREERGGGEHGAATLKPTKDKRQARGGEHGAARGAPKRKTEMTRRSMCWWW